MRFTLLAGALLISITTSSAMGQLDPLSRKSSSAGNPLTQPTLSQGARQLMQLDVDFSTAVAKGGGKAFATWFADDALALNNGKPPVIGKVRIAADANWDPQQYQLTWEPIGAQMGPSGDMGFTYGHYDGHARDANGNKIDTSGRYITVWKRVQDGTWKVALDASADEAPAAGDCCKLPNP
jgi:ketosteroid isomerase-like protein